MQIAVTVRHGTLSDATRDKIVGKVEKLRRYFDRLGAVEVTIDLAHSDQPEVDLRVSAEHKHDFAATARADDLFAALEEALARMEQQLRKYKERIQEHHRGSGDRAPGVSQPDTEEA